MSEPTSRKKPKPIFRSVTFWLAVAFVGTSWGFWIKVARENWKYSSETYAKFGQFGDMFGSLNALFAGLAFIGVVFTLYRQHQDGLDADAKHGEMIDQQERVTKIQGLTALLNFEHEHFVKLCAAIAYLDRCHHLVSEARKHAAKPLMSEYLQALENERHESAIHLDSEEVGAFDRAYRDFSEGLGKYANLYSVGGPEKESAFTTTETAHTSLLTIFAKWKDARAKEKDGTAKLLKGYKIRIRYLVKEQKREQKK